MKKVFLKLGSILIVSLFIASCSLKDSATKSSIYLIGDSTMSDRKDTASTPLRGWGQELHKFFNEDVIIKNHAISGRSTKSFIDQGHWDKVVSLLKPGDYVFIQFGHNDQKENDASRYTNPYTGYRRNMEKFVDETKSKKANPIILSSIVRRNFNDNGTLVDTHGTYPLIAREVAKEKGVPFIDLQLKTEDLVIGLGQEESKKIYVWIEPGKSDRFPKGILDNTHLSEYGATEVGRLTVEGLRQIKSPLCKNLIKQE